MKLEAAVLCCLTLAVACAKQPPPNPPDPKLRHEGAYRAQRRIEGAIAVGVSYVRLGELLQDLSAELLVASDRAAAPAEKELVALYQQCLQTYADSSTLWKHKIEDDNRSWTEGGIYQSPDLVPIVARYKLSTKPKKDWTAISGDAVQTVWAVAGETCGKATKAYLALNAAPPTTGPQG